MFDPKILLDTLLTGASEGTKQTRQQSAGLPNVLSDLLKHAGQNQSTSGSGNILNDLIGQLATGQSTDDLLDKAKDLIGGNKTAAGAIAGALGGLLLGSKTGRSLSYNAVKLGGLILIGSLAYKAYQDYSSGGATEQNFSDHPEEAPIGSGFEADVQTDKNAITFVRAMIAAASADGEISNDERQTIVGNMKEAGLNPAAADFLNGEFANPAAIDELVKASTDEKSAVQIYTAARLAIEPDHFAEKGFLSELAKGLQLDERLVESINSQVKSIKV